MSATASPISIGARTLSQEPRANTDPSLPRQQRGPESKPLLAELDQRLTEAGADPAVDCVILTGAGRAFSAGADISEMLARGVDAYADPERERAVQAAFEQLLRAGLETEHRLTVTAFATADRVEGLQAFMEKRPTRFRGC